MIVDDSQTFLMCLGLLLTRMNYRVIPADTGVELFGLLKLTKPDAILLDLHMPMMDGLKILKHIKGDKQTSAIPVIMVTTDGHSGSIEKCKDLGCYAYLTKPVKIDKLHGILEKCFYSCKGTKREHLREKFVRRLPVTYEGKQHEFYSECLSEGGVYLRTKEPFPVGSEIELTLALGSAKSMRLKGDVIYEKKICGDFLDLPPGMAVRFKGLTDDEMLVIKRYVQDLLAKDILDGQEERVIEKS